MCAAQNQHYVPKFILRQFCVDPDKEQVAVFDKKNNKIFKTSIKNIMAERRFNDFVYDDMTFTFEHAAGRLENLSLPAYRRVCATESLDCGSIQERVDLALLIAFQFSRTKSSRQMLMDVKSALIKKMGKGASAEDIERIFGLDDENSVKQANLFGLKDEILEYMKIIAEKRFFLMRAPPGRSFYLGDDPVVLHNENDFGPYGNIGLAVRGIQISMPLTPALLVCAWCPTIFRQLQAELDRLLPEARRRLLDMVLSRQISSSEMKIRLEDFERDKNLIFAAAKSGKPLQLNSANMDFYNSRQIGTAHRYVVCQRADLDLAKRFNIERPGTGRSFRVA